MSRESRAVTAGARSQGVGFETLKHLGAAHALQHIMVGIIGSRDASAPQLDAAERIGHALGQTGLTLICGGRSGAMTAASRDAPTPGA